MGRGQYIRGARFERQLKHLLERKGFYVIRAGKSGGDGVSPDLIALSTTKKFALECKAWEATSLHFDPQKVQIMRAWEQQTGVPFYVAWKQNREEWRFFPLFLLKENPKGYSLTSGDYSAGMTLENLLS
ncbi:MAG: restriction endonuclease [Candidatus Micrarchaeota archaeon]